LEIQTILPAGIDVDLLRKTIDFIRQIDVLPYAKRETVILQEKE